MVATINCVSLQINNTAMEQNELHLFEVGGRSKTFISLDLFCKVFNIKKQINGYLPYFV